MRKKYFSVAVGGFWGALARYWLGTWIHGLSPGSFPWGTLVVNLLGCFFLGFFLSLPLEQRKAGTHLRLAVGTGFTGAFTTFSTFSVETVSMLQSRNIPEAFLYVTLNVFGGYLLAELGALGAAYLSKPKQECQPEEA